jgi:hypothetical protein
VHSSLLSYVVYEFSAMRVHLVLFLGMLAISLLAGRAHAEHEEDYDYAECEDGTFEIEDGAR